MCLPQLSRLVSTKLKVNLIDFERYMAIIGISSMKDSEKYASWPKDDERKPSSRFNRVHSSRSDKSGIG